jgi:hypothetical protein
MIPVLKTRSLSSRYIVQLFFLINCFFVDLRSAGANPQVVEHVAPLAAEVGQEFLDNLASRGQKNKAPASDVGTSEDPPAKRHKKKSGDKPYGSERRHEMPVAAG